MASTVREGNVDVFRPFGHKVECLHEGENRVAELPPRDYEKGNKSKFRVMRGHHQPGVTCEEISLISSHCRTTLP